MKPVSAMRMRLKPPMTTTRNAPTVASSRVSDTGREDLASELDAHRPVAGSGRG